MTGALLLLLLGGAPAAARPTPDSTESGSPRAEDGEASTDVPEPDDAGEGPDSEEAPRRRWGGLIIPLIGATTTDGFGFGIGGEVFRRPADGSEAYDLKITPSLYVNVRFDYTNDLVRVDWRAPDGTIWLAQVGFSAWANMAYAGVGGEDVILDHGTAEIGNTFAGPYGFVSATRPIRGSDWRWIGMVYGRGGWADPDPASLMAVEQPYGVQGGAYLDGTFGLALEAVDRWPVPTHGHILEVSASAGGTVTPDGFEPLVGGQIEAMGWRPLWKDRLTVGSRLLVTKTLGQRPFFEQDKAMGRWRDELGSEQALAGYGRTRTRGDGTVALLVEARPHLFAIDTGSIAFAGHLSLTAELGWLYDRFDPGPPLPTVGVGMPLLWQRAVQLRPFLAWGWRREDPTAPRRPGMQVGISVLDAL